MASLSRAVRAARSFATKASAPAASEAYPSFTKALFAGELRSSSIAPYPVKDVLGQEHTETLKMLVEPTRQFFAEVNDAKKNDETGSIPDNVLAGLREMGAYGLQVPDEYGGLGLTNTGYARLVEVVGGADLGVGIHLGAHQSIGFKAILLFGTPEQKAKYLPKLAAGEHVAAFALTEPSSGSDAASVRTRATLSADGKHWVLNGGKLWISNGDRAEVFTVYANTPVKDPKNPMGPLVDKMTAFIVERSFGGVTSGPLENKMGIKCSPTTEVYFDNVKVPVENVVGEVGKGFKVCMEVLNNGRFGMGAALTGTQKFLLAGAAEHANNRTQFLNRKIGSYGAIRAKLAGMAARCYGTESLAYLLAANMDRGMTDYSLEAACSKIFASEAAFWAADEAIQIYGGLGFMKAFPYERILRDLRIFRIFEGTNDILRLLIAGTGLMAHGKSLEPLAAAAKNPLGNLSALLPFAQKVAKARFLGQVESMPSLEWAPAELKDSAATLAKATAAFGDACTGLLLRHKKKLIEEQMVLTAVADCAIALTVSSAALSRAARALKEGSPTAAAEAALANLTVAELSVGLATNLAHVQSHAKGAYGSTVRGPQPNFKALEKLRHEVAEQVLAAGGYTATPPVGF